MSIYGQQIGRQPFRAGMHSYYRGPQQVNINHTEITRNYFNGGGYNMGMYGGYGDCCGGYEMSKGEKWMTGIGIALGIGGAIWGAVDNGGGGDGTSEVAETSFTPEQQKLIDEQNKKMQALEDKISTLTSEKEKLEAVNPKAQSKSDEVAHLKQIAREYSANAREIPGNNLTTPFTVEAKKNEDGTVTGHTGYNIVAGKYKSSDGKPLTDSEIKAVAQEIFAGKALPTGEIQLPNSVNVNGKTYNINPEGEVKPSTYNLASSGDLYQSSARQEGSKWVAVVDGNDIPGATYNSKDEALKAANDEISRKKATDNAETEN